MRACGRKRRSSFKPVPFNIDGPEQRSFVANWAPGFPSARCSGRHGPGIRRFALYVVHDVPVAWY
jgi:hypothetical protein